MAKKSFFLHLEYIRNLAGVQPEPGGIPVESGIFFGKPEFFFKPSETPQKAFRGLVWFVSYLKIAKHHFCLFGILSGICLECSRRTAVFRWYSGGIPVVFRRNPITYSRNLLKISTQKIFSKILSDLILSNYSTNYLLFFFWNFSPADLEFQQKYLEFL